MAAQLFTVRMALTSCGVDDITLFNGRTAAERMANEIFLDNFEVCMDKTADELKEDLKSYSNLTLAEGRIRTLPGVQNRIRAFIQWAKDQIRQGIDPTTRLFPVNEVADLLYRKQTHENFVRTSKTLSEAAKPSTFTKDVRWEDFNPNLQAYLRLIPGRNGHPLSYIIRANEVSDRTRHPDFLDDYVSAAPLNGSAYAVDNATVYTIIQHLIAGNEEAESKVVLFTDTTDGRGSYISLKNHYQGTGVMATDVTSAEEIIATLFYNGERKPYMWWTEFERKLTHAHAVLDRAEGREVYSDQQKLRKLLTRIKADFLGNQKAAIEVELSKVPVTMAYDIALTTFRTAVNTKFPSNSNSFNPKINMRRHIQKLEQGKKKRYGGGSSGEHTRRRTDSEMIKLPAKGGKPSVTIEYHPSFHYPMHLLHRFTPELISRLD